MTAPDLARMARQKLSEYVTEMFPKWRSRMSPEEIDLAPYLRGNQPLFDALNRLLQTRIAGRASVPEPSDPQVAKSMVARDREIQWVMNRLAFIYHSPVNPAGEQEERPA